MNNHFDCDTCNYRQPHPTMFNTSICTNEESEHYGSFIDESHPDYGNSDPDCYSKNTERKH